MMNKILIRILLFATYFLLLSAALEFKLSLIINLRMLFFVVIGTALLTGMNLLKGIEKKKLQEKVIWNLMVTGYLTTFLAQLSLFSKPIHLESMYLDIVSNFLPLFYSLLLYLAFELFSGKPTMEAEASKSIDDAGSPLEGLDLTKRERMIVNELLKDLSNRDIGEKLFISENTVKKHVQNILKKANVKNRTEFVMQYKGSRVNL